MSVLRSIETKLAGLVEGTFSRVFRSEVRPIEIARKLAREMDEHRSQSLSRVYVPHEYQVFLSPEDHDRFAELEDELTSELSGYLLEYARREGLALTAKPVIEFHTDETLGLGEFGIQTGAISHRGDDALPEEEASGRTMIHSTSSRLSETLSERAQVRQETALLRYEGKRLVVGPGGVTLGRSRTCDVVLDDPNVSRRHAELRPRGGSWAVSDLGSTNGVSVNGRRIDGPHVVRGGDVIELGSTRVEFELES